MTPKTITWPHGVIFLSHREDQSTCKGPQLLDLILLRFDLEMGEEDV
jgi:hypothetical protein